MRRKNMSYTVALLIELIIDIDNGTSGVSEYRLYVLLDKRLYYNFRSAQFRVAVSFLSK